MSKGIPASPGTRQLASRAPDITDPALAYLVSLPSRRSRASMASLLGLVAIRAGYTSVEECPWHALDRAQVRGILSVLVDDGKAPATVNTYLAAIKGVCREAWAMGKMDTDTWQHIRDVRGIRGSRLSSGRSLSGIEIAALFRSCGMDNTSKGARDSAILAVMLGCGLRRSEVVALDVGDFDARESSLRVLGKGNKERIAYLPPTAALRVQDWLQVRLVECAPLFTRIHRSDRQTGQRLTDQAVYHILHQRRLEAGVDPFSPHDLRRTFASAMLANHEDIITVRDAMGHASVTTTQKYDRRDQDRLQEASRRLGVVP